MLAKRRFAPFFAPVAAVVCLGMTGCQPVRRAVELIVGVGLGIGLGDLLISATGTGPWQIALVVALAMSVAVLLDGGAVITVQAAVSAILVATLYLSADASGVDRLVDGLIGSATGLLVWACSREALSAPFSGANGATDGGRGR